MAEWINQLPHTEAKRHFDGLSADIMARKLLLDKAEHLYVGPGDTRINRAVCSLLHACDYLQDRVGYEMNPHPAGRVRFYGGQPCIL